MPDMRETLKYTFTVEGETEQWYLLWLGLNNDRIKQTQFRGFFPTSVTSEKSRIYFFKLEFRIATDNPFYSLDHTS